MQSPENVFINNEKGSVVLKCINKCISPLYRRSYTQCCNMCYPLFLFIILAACVMACSGLIWMQIALKEDLDALKEKLHSSKTYCLTHSYLVMVIKTSLSCYIQVAQSCIPLALTLLLTYYTVFITVESSQKVSSSEIPKLSEDLKSKERKLDDLENGDKGLSKLWSNLTEINRKVGCFYHFEATLKH